MDNLAEESRLFRNKTSNGFCGLRCIRATPLLETDEEPVEVLIVVTLDAMELLERVLRIDMIEGDPLEVVADEVKFVWGFRVLE
jgi:hypothetical protein